MQSYFLWFSATLCRRAEWRFFIFLGGELGVENRVVGEDVAAGFSAFFDCAEIQCRSMPVFLERF
jgi:hypothetical protein